MTSRHSAKKPSGGRPNVRKLLSKGSLGSLSSFVKPDSDNEQLSGPSSTVGSRKATGNQGSTVPSLGVINEKESSPWLSGEFASSPRLDKGEGEILCLNDEKNGNGIRIVRTENPTSTHSNPEKIRTPTSAFHDSDASDSGSQPPASPSSARWKSLRHHILPEAQITSTPNPSVTSFPQFSSPASTPSSQTTPLTRPSRLATRFGFRQVVVETQHVADQTTRRFADEIQKACWEVRYTDSRSVKPEREATQPSTLSSTLHLPFMSSTSLPLTNTSISNLSAPSTLKNALRGQPSVANLSGQAGNRLQALTNLQGIIMRFAAVQDSVVSKLLPHEPDVLSVLLVPFLRQTVEQIVEDERRLSLQLFESVLTTWRPSSDVGIQRCIWCCKAAAMPASPLRQKIIYDLKGILMSTESPLNNCLSITTVVSHLVILAELFDGGQSVPSSSFSKDLPAVLDLISLIISGKCGRLSMEDLEKSFDAVALGTDTVEDLRTGLCVRSIVNCTEFGGSDQRSGLFRYVEKYWSGFDTSRPVTPLRAKLHLDKVSAFVRSAIGILQDSLIQSSVLTLSDSKHILKLLRNRVLPELAFFKAGAEGLASTIRTSCVKVILLLLTFEATNGEDTEDTFAKPRGSQAREMLLDWITDASGGWQDAVEKEVKDIPSSFDWTTSPIIAYNLLFSLPDDIRKRLAILLTTQFQEKIVKESPPQASEPLTRLLALLASMCPQVFYKPLFLCAASTREETVSRQIATLTTLGRFMPNFWTSDAEMLSVALMSDPGSNTIGKGKTKEGEKVPWAKQRLGQTMILLEVIVNLRTYQKGIGMKHSESTSSSMAFQKVVKFASSLETRLAVLINAKEENMLVPVSQRILFATLFSEIRLLSSTLKSPPWLPRMVAWTLQHTSRDGSFQESIPEGEREGLWRIPAQIYAQSNDTFKPTHQRKGTANLLSPQRNTFIETTSDSNQSSVQMRTQLLENLANDPLPSFLRVLVLLSGSLKHDDYVLLSPVLWEKCLLLQDKASVLNACFLCMQCAEKAHDKFVSLVIAHLQSPSSTMRRDSVLRLAILTNWRFQLLSLNFLTDRANRRAFKLARPPLNFVATDIGDSKYIPHNDIDDAISGKKHALPLDIRRRLMEIGWADEEEPVDEILEWRRTPMSLLGTTQIDQIAGADNGVDEASGSDHGHTSPGCTPSKSSSPGRDGMARRTSSRGMNFGKRRPVFVEPLVAVFLPLAKIAMENDFSTASIAQDLILDYMRDDPAVLCRSAFTIFSDERQTIDRAVTSLRYLASLRRVLPPRFTHHAFNNLAGYLKYLSKNMESKNALHDFSLTLPLLARLAPQVSDISIRGIRRAKIEMFMFPSGSLFFNDPAPIGPMFPRDLDYIDPFAECPSELLQLVMIRMSQNMFALDMLKRAPQDVHIIRKAWTPLVLPDIPFYTDIDSTLPMRKETRHILDQSRPTLRISLSFSRTHLLLVAQLFRCLTRHLNDRAELAMFLDGVNQILLRHRDDIGIVSHAIICYLIASTRFRRLMSSGTGFTIFLPALMKVYCEAEGDVNVREAIEYAFHRFFAVHEETFVYQALQVVSNVVTQPSVDGHWVASTTYHLLSMLKANPSEFDAAGIRDATKAQEEETAMAITADERPQVFLTSLREKGRTNAEKLQSSFSLDIFDNKRFQPDNIVRMILTVIAHDPTLRRAQYFLRLFRYLVPHLYKASNSARTVLRDGVDALANIITSKMAKTKDGMLTKAKATGEPSEPLLHERNSNEKSSTNPSAPCDVQVMRSDYLILFASYVKEGGAHRVTSLQRSLDLVKILLKDAEPSSAATESIKLFMDQLGETFIIRQDVKYTISLLKDLTPIIKMHGIVIDLSGLLKSLTTLASIPTFANDTKFGEAVVSQICAAALEVAELAAQDNILSGLSFVPSLVSLLAESVCLLNIDVVSEIEKRDPSPAFLTGVVMPFVFQLRTTKELALNTQWTDSSRQDAHSRAWSQLLSYAVSAFMNPIRQERMGLKARDSMKRSPSFTSSTPPADEDSEIRPSSSIRRAKRRPSGQGTIVASTRLAVAFIVLKAVVYRGEEDISRTFPGAWVHVGGIIRSVIQDGSVTFLFRPEQISVPPSPLPSPNSTKSFSEFLDKQSEPTYNSSSQTLLADPFTNAASSRSRPSSPTNDPTKRRSTPNLPSPRFIDYILWSCLEFLCLRQTPLSIQLRGLMHEKAYFLNDILQDRMSVSAYGLSARLRGARPATIYSKPRMKLGSANSTPEASPRLGPSDPGLAHSSTYSTFSTFSLHSGIDANTFNQSPSSGTRLKPTIKSTNSVSQSYLSPALIPTSVSGYSMQSKAEQNEEMDMAFDTRQTLRATSLQSPTLVRITYDRIRNVQRYLGYKAILPLPQDVIDSARQSLDAHERAIAFPLSHSSMLFERHDAEPEPRAWSRAQTAELLLAEAHGILNAWLVEKSVKASFIIAKQADTSSGLAEGSTDVSFVPVS